MDDDHGLLRLIERSLRREGYSPITASSGREALARLQQQTADLILLDLKLPDFDGNDLIDQISRLDRRIPFVIITGQGDERVAVEMMKRGALDYLVKDLRFQEFVPAVVRRALTQIERDKKLAQAEEELHRAHDLLEKRIEERTAALAKANTELQIEVNERQRAEDALRLAHAQLEQRVRERTAELAKANAALQADIAKRKQLETEILEISAREQRRIGQDLHDGLGQHLAGIELLSQVLEQELSKISKGAAAQAARISEYVRDAMLQASSLARGLSPVVLESQGLMFALNELASRTERLFAVSCKFQCEAPVLIDDNDIAIHLYRIVQEAVTNAVKHGKATQIEIGLNATRGRMRLLIRDNGCGLPRKRTSNSGMGLRIMQYRASMIGGSVTVRNASRGGTTVACAIHPFPTQHRPRTNHALPATTPLKV